MDTTKVPPTLANASVGGTSFLLFVYPVHPKPWGNLWIESVKTAEGLPTFYLGALLVQEECDTRIKDIRNPDCNGRWHISVHGKGGSNRLEQDIRET